MQRVETEIKLKLQDKTDVNKLKEYFGNPKYVEKQTNHYLDHKDDQFSKSKSTFRIRLVNDERAYVTFKGKIYSENGVFSSNELEEELDFSLAIKSLNTCDFSDVYQNNSVFKTVLDTRNIDPKDIKILGSIGTTRYVYSWEDHLLDIDDSDYGFATNYEVELETLDPINIKQKLTTLLHSLSISFEDSKANKFTNFLNKKIL